MENKDIIKFQLKNPIIFNEKEIKEVKLDFHSLTGSDICDAESDFRGRFYTVIPDANYAKGYQAAVAAKASGLPYDCILSLSIKDFSKVTGATKGFLME